MCSWIFNERFIANFLLNVPLKEHLESLIHVNDYILTCCNCKTANKKAQLTQGLRATTPSFQDGLQPPSWILSNRK